MKVLLYAVFKDLKDGTLPGSGPILDKRDRGTEEGFAPSKLSSAVSRSASLAHHRRSDTHALSYALRPRSSMSIGSRTWFHPHNVRVCATTCETRRASYPRLPLALIGRRTPEYYGIVCGRHKYVRSCDRARRDPTACTP